MCQNFCVDSNDAVDIFIANFGVVRQELFHGNFEIWRGIHIAQIPVFFSSQVATEFRRNWDSRLKTSIKGVDVVWGLWSDFTIFDIDRRECSQKSTSWAKFVVILKKHEVFQSLSRPPAITGICSITGLNSVYSTEGLSWRGIVPALNLPWLVGRRVFLGSDLDQFGLEQWRLSACLGRWRQALAALYRVYPG